MKKFVCECLSENGKPSSKRVVGVFGMFLIHALVCYTGARHGITENIESVMITLILMDGSLLGITTIANALSK